MENPFKESGIRRVLFFAGGVAGGFMSAVIIQQYRIPDDWVFGCALAVVALFAGLLISSIKFETRHPINVIITVAIVVAMALIGKPLWSVIHQDSKLVIEAIAIGDQIIAFADAKPNIRGGGPAIVSEFDNKWRKLVTAKRDEIAKQPNAKVEKLDVALDKHLINSGDVWGDIRKIGEELKSAAKTAKD